MCARAHVCVESCVMCICNLFNACVFLRGLSPESFQSYSGDFVRKMLKRGFLWPTSLTGRLSIVKLCAFSSALCLFSDITFIILFSTLFECSVIQTVLWESERNCLTNVNLQVNTEGDRTCLCF